MLERYLSQIGMIVASPKIKQYLVGITANVQSRQRAYDAKEFEYFVILRVGLSKEKALDLEERLFNALNSDKVLKKKYHGEKSRYSRSTGGKSGSDYCLYLAGF